MAKIPESATRVYGFRKSLGMTQSEFGKAYKVPQPTVSDYESGLATPSAEVYLRLAKAAPYPENVWFLQQIGLDPDDILTLAEGVSIERSAPPMEGEIFRVPVIERTSQGNKETGDFFPAPARIVQHPASTICLTVHEDCANRTLPVGDIILLDTSHSDLGYVAPFLGQIVLVDVEWGVNRFSNISRNHFYPHNTFMGSRYLSSARAPEGLYMGLLRLKWSNHPAPERSRVVAGIATLGFVSHFENEPESVRDDELCIGAWYGDFHKANEGQEVSQIDEAKDREKILSVARMGPPCGILGRVLAWFPKPVIKATG